MILFFTPTLYIALHNKSMSSKDATSLHVIDSYKTIEPTTHLLSDKLSQLLEAMAAGGSKAGSEGGA